MVIESINISSQLKNISDIENLIDRVSSAISITEERYGDILISVTEAFNNAVIHGNKFDLNLPVSVNVSEDDSYLTFTISDGGKGFDYTHLPDPTAPENLETDCGRGIFLIQNLSDKVSFNEKGNVINISFLLK